MIRSPEDFKLIGEGRNRLTYLSPSKKYVIKVPKNPEGIRNNFFEARDCKKDSWLYRNQKAKCRMWGYLLVMEYVKPVYNFWELPNWILTVDCQQVGYDRKGNLVAFDFAY